MVQQRAGGVNRRARRLQGCGNVVRRPNVRQLNPWFAGYEAPDGIMCYTRDAAMRAHLAMLPCP